MKAKSRAFQGYLESDGKGQHVGARTPTYKGPEVLIKHDARWLFIVADNEGGHVVLNIEALPKLRLALSRVARKIRTKGTKK